MAAWFLSGVALAADPPDARGSMLSFRKLSAHSAAALGPSPTPLLGELRDRLALPPNATCEVLLAVAASSVNPSDFEPAVAADDFPRVLGSDVAALVLRAGRSCRRLAAGDRVWGDIGANALTYRSRAPTKELGAYAPYAVALEAQLGRLPRLLSLREGGAVPKVGLTSLKALRWYAGAPAAWRWRRADSTVLVLGGSGGTGSMGLQLAKAYGAARLITTTSAANFDYCRSLGAEVLIDYHRFDWWNESVVADQSVDVVYDTVGQPGTGERAIRKLRAGGVYVTITGALAPLPLPPNISQAFFINSDTNLGSADLLEELAQLFDAGKLVAPRLDSVFPLRNISAGFARVATRHTVGKVVIEM